VTNLRRFLQDYWPNWLRGRWGWAATLAGLYTAVFAVWCFTHWGDAAVGIFIERLNAQTGWQLLGEPSAFISDIAYLPLTLLGALACWRVARLEKASLLTRRAWLFIGFACLANFVGDVLWFYYEIIARTSPTPSWADVGYLAFYVFTMLGLLSFPYAPISRSERQRLYLDVAIILVGSWMVTWYFILAPSVPDLHFDLLSALAVAYPMGDLAIIYGLAVYLFRRPSIAWRSGFGFLLAGMLLFVVADCVYSVESLNGTYFSGEWVDSLWLITYLFFGYAALEQYANLRRRGERFRVARRVRYLWVLPYVMLAFGYGLVLVAFYLAPEISSTIRGLMVGAILLTALISVRHILELQENRRLSAEARRRLQQLEKADADLSRAQRLASVGTLAAGVAHEINNPLSAIIASVRILKRRVNAGEWDKEAFLIALARMEKSAWHGAKIAQALVTYARGSELALTRVGVQSLVEIALKISPVPPEAGIEVSVTVTPEYVEVICDPDQLTQVLAHLIGNARDAITPPGRIDLQATQDPQGGLRLQVRDTGAGMSPEVLAHAFDPFYTNKPFGQGTGLGLSICRGIVQAHEGQIHLESQVGQGTQVTLTLPPEPRVPVTAEPAEELEFVD